MRVCSSGYLFLWVSSLFTAWGFAILWCNRSENPILGTICWDSTCCGGRPSLYWQLLWDGAKDVVENLILPLPQMLSISMFSFWIFISKHLIILCGSLSQTSSVFDIKMIPCSFHSAAITKWSTTNLGSAQCPARANVLMSQSCGVSYLCAFTTSVKNPFNKFHF